MRDLDDADPAVRLRALLALAQRPHPTAVEAVRSRLRDPDAEVRSKAVGVLATLLQHRDPTVPSGRP